MSKYTAEQVIHAADLEQAKYDGDLIISRYLRDYAALLRDRESVKAVVPDGWQLVPVDATLAMQSAGGHANSEWLNDNAPIGENRYGGPVMRSVWQAMLAAAPKPEAEE